jgi:60S ribosome subunit biogenesis protein NIP7
MVRDIAIASFCASGAFECAEVLRSFHTSNFSLGVGGCACSFRRPPHFFGATASASRLPHCDSSLFTHQHEAPYRSTRPRIGLSLQTANDSQPETKTLFEKLAGYCGKGIQDLITAGGADDRHVFRIQGSRVYYVRESLANLATSCARDNLLSLGTCLGKFTKTGKFRLHVTALSVIAPHARYKVWVKQNGEMPFLYGGNVLKAHVGRWSEDCPEHQGVIVLNMSDTPLVSCMQARLGKIR